MSIEIQMLCYQQLCSQFYSIDLTMTHAKLWSEHMRTSITQNWQTYSMPQLYVSVVTNFHFTGIIIVHRQCYYRSNNFHKVVFPCYTCFHHNVAVGYHHATCNAVDLGKSIDLTMRWLHKLKRRVSHFCRGKKQE